MATLDASLTLHDGTAITADLSPTAEARTSGSIVYDLQAGQAAYGSGLMDMSAILVDPDGLTDTNDDVDVYIQACATVDGTYVTIAQFQQIGGTVYTGVAGSVQVIRFGVDPQHRYVRAHIDITDDSGSDFSEVLYVFLSPYAFYNI